MHTFLTLSTIVSAKIFPSYLIIAFMTSLLKIDDVITLDFIIYCAPINSPNNN